MSDLQVRPSGVPDQQPRTLNGDGPSSPSPSRHASISLQAAATLNASLHREESPRGTVHSPLSPRHQSPSSERRRSQVLMNLQIADPTLPGPGEMVADSQPSSFRAISPISASPHLVATRDPFHRRTPSIGEIHQELENEQEFQVNRLLAEIRRLQEENAQLSRNQQGVSSETTERTAPVPIMTSFPHAAYPGGSSGSLPRSPVLPLHPRSSFDLARADLHRRSRTPSRGASPGLRSTSISGDSGEQLLLGGRDESAFYQAETQMLIRENQMLRHRIRELERNLTDLSGSNTGLAHEPPHSSRLHRSTSVSEEEPSRPVGATGTSAEASKST